MQHAGEREHERSLDARQFIESEVDLLSNRVGNPVLFAERIEFLVDTVDLR